jgi:hypothetical protein
MFMLQMYNLVLITSLTCRYALYTKILLRAFSKTALAYLKLACIETVEFSTFLFTAPEKL